MAKTKPSTTELLDLLAAAIDGVDGYESENGELRYWDEKKINRARDLLDAQNAGQVASVDNRGPGSGTPR